MEVQANTVLKKLLGSLELEVMSFMWQAGNATVQEATNAISHKKPIAYTTIMTIMVHLVDKGLLTRAKYGKRFRYKIVLSKQEFVRDSAKSRLHDLIGDFGDIAAAQLVEEVQKIDTGRLEKLRSLIQERADENNTTKQSL